MECCAVPPFLCRNGGFQETYLWYDNNIINIEIVSGIDALENYRRMQNGGWRMKGKRKQMLFFKP